MKKAKWSKDGMKMLIETGHKTFDRQTNLITSGNVFANTQFSSFIRPWNDLGEDLPGEPRPPGHLFEFDLRGFATLGRLDKCKIRNATETFGPVILYQFHHWRKDKKIVHGYVLAKSNKDLLDYWTMNNTRKSRSVIQECIKYITNGEHDE